MKRSARVFALSFLILLTMLVESSLLAAPPTKSASGPKKPASAPAKKSSPAPAKKPAPPIDFKQCQGEKFRIDLLEALDALPRDTPDAHIEQLRDWVWTTLVGRLAAKNAQPELLNALARQPVLRDESLSHLLDLQAGRSRSLSTIVDKKAYVLVQKTSPQRMREDALEAIDHEARLLGEYPRSVQIYSVDFQTDTAEAEVCKLGSVDQKWITSPDQGFRHRRITKATELTDFLAGGVDLLSASCTASESGSVLETSGRLRSRAARAPITLSHVAALSQGILTEVENEDDPISELLAEDSEDLGFSLDPRMETAKALRYLDLLVEFGDAATDEQKETLKTLADQMRSSSPFEAEHLLLQAMSSTEDKDLAAIFDHVRKDSSYQCARYDGPLQGTEAGMTMFYTDLLVKLWDFNWNDSAPTGIIPGFVSTPERSFSSVHCEDDKKVPNTRLWLGSRQEAYIRPTPTSIQFDPKATRLFALGSALGAGHSEEKEPASDSLALIRWWNSHYLEVAEWEPQYELLNQLIKWTLVRRMAELDPATSQCLTFLNGVEVDRTKKFDRWVQENNDLSWREPVQLLSKDGETTECLPTFKSAGFEICGESMRLSGGVSLSPKTDVSVKPVGKPQEPPKVITPTETTLHPPDLELPSGRVKSVEIKSSPGRSQVKAKLESDIQIRTKVVKQETQQADIEYGKESRLTDGGRRLEVKLTEDQFGIGNLEARDLQSATARIKVEPGAREQAGRLALQISERVGREGGDFPTISKTVAGDLPVQTWDQNLAVVELAPGKGQEKIYAVMSSGTGNHGPPDLPPGPRFLIGASEPPRDGRSNVIFVALLPEKDAKPYLALKQARLIDASPLMRSVQNAPNVSSARELIKGADVPPEAIAEVALKAIGSREINIAEEMVDRLVGMKAAADLNRVGDSVARAVLSLNRRQADALIRNQISALDALGMKVAISQRRLSAADAEHLMAHLEDQSSPIVYAPLGFPKEAKLPPASHDLGRWLPPNERFVSVVVDYAGRRSSAPREIQVDDVKLQVRERPPLQVSYRPGSPYRIPPPPFPGDGGEAEDEDRDKWPVVIVLPCALEDEDDADDSKLPACYRAEEDDLQESFDLADLEDMTKLLRCDLNQNGEMDSPEEEECVEKAFMELLGIDASLLTKDEQ
jgi:hypothetical protein